MDEGDRTVIRTRVCEDGAIALDPLHRRAISAEIGGYVPGSGWEQVDNEGCPDEPAPQVVWTVEESALIRTTVAGHEWPHHAALGGTRSRESSSYG